MSSEERRLAWESWLAEQHAALAPWVYDVAVCQQTGQGFEAGYRNAHGAAAARIAELESFVQAVIGHDDWLAATARRTPGGDRAAQLAYARATEARWLAVAAQSRGLLLGEGAR